MAGRGGSWKPELYEKAQVLSFYDNYDNIVAWRLYQGTSPQAQYLRCDYGINEDGELENGINKGDGNRELDNAITVLMSNPNNTNIYCLQLVRNPKRKNVPKNGSIEQVPFLQVNFQLHGAQTQMVPYGNVGGFSNGNETSALVGRIKELEENLQRIQEEETETVEEPQNSIVGFVKNILEKRPDIVDRFVNVMFPPLANDKAAAAISGTDSESLQKSIDRLCRIDDKFSYHLDIIATFAEANPIAYGTFIDQLEKM